MRRAAGTGALCLAAALAAGLLGGCEYARMTNDEAVHTHEQSLPPLPSGLVPAGGGEEMLRHADPKTLTSPVAPAPGTSHEGKRVYANFCVHCHGPRADGNGTVGQSFSPLPTDLAGPAVRSRTDGELFAHISYGYGRHPPLSDTVSVADRWAVVAYLRSLPPRSGKRAASDPLSPLAPRG